MINPLQAATRGRIRPSRSTQGVLVLALSGLLAFSADVTTPPLPSSGGVWPVHSASKRYAVTVSPAAFAIRGRVAVVNRIADTFTVEAKAARFAITAKPSTVGEQYSVSSESAKVAARGSSSTVTLTQFDAGETVASVTVESDTGEISVLREVAAMPRMFAASTTSSADIAIIRAAVTAKPRVIADALQMRRSRPVRQVRQRRQGRIRLRDRGFPSQNDMQGAMKLARQLGLDEFVNAGSV